MLGVDEGIGVDFLGGGNCLKLEGVTQPGKWKYRASLMARTEVLEVPLGQFSSDPVLRQELAATFSSMSTAGSALPPTIDLLPDLNALKAAEKEIATGIVDGVNVLVMDMDLCVRCGELSLACHKVHGQSRLLRRGIHIERPVSSARYVCSMLWYLRRACIAPILNVLRAVPLARSFATRSAISTSIANVHRLFRLRDAMSLRRDRDGCTRCASGKQ